MDESSNISFDVEGELEKLRDDIKRKQNLINDKDKIISSLKLQISDLDEDNQEFERELEILKQKIDRLERNNDERNQEVEALSRALQEVNTSNDNIQAKLNKRTEQIQKLIQELASTKKDLDLSLAANDDLRVQNQELSSQAGGARRGRRCRDEEDTLAMEMSNLRSQTEKLSSENEALKGQIKKLNELVNRPPPTPQPVPVVAPVHVDQTNEEMVQELYDLRAQVKTLSHRLSRRSVDEQISNLQEELKVTETSWKFERLHKERYAKENTELEKQLAKLQKEKLQLEKELKNVNSPPPPPLPPKPFQTQQKPQLTPDSQQKPPPPLPPKPGDENKTELTAGIHFSMADEEGELMQSHSILKRSNKRAADDVKPNYKIQKPRATQEPIDPTHEYKMRCERAKELARRNMQTKPLHQTSYPLELDTFETSNLTEVDIKRGKVNRGALVDSSNKRKPIKKAEAFVV